MAEASTTPATQDSNPHHSQPENNNPHPNHPNLPPDSTQPSSSTTTTTTTTQLPPSTAINPNPNPNPNPSSAPPLVSPLPPQISPYGHPPPVGSSSAAIVPPAAPLFRPAGVPAPISSPQFTPIPPNPNLMAPPQQQMYPGQPPNPAMRPPYLAMHNGYMAPVPQGTIPPPGVIRYPYPPFVWPPFLLRPAGAVGTVLSLPRPPFLGVRLPVPPLIVRPPVLPVVIPAEKPQTTVYVGKIAPSVENEFIRSLLELCGPIKSWKRAQDPSDGTPRRFGFCEFESAEGVLRALRLLSKCNVDGEELVLNVNQATKEYLERYVEKKKENLNKPSETEAEEAKKEGESTTDVEKGEDDKQNKPAKPAVDEPKKDEKETGNKESDVSVLGLVTDEDRDADREALEKLTSMVEERIKTKPPPPPPAQKVVDGANNSNSEGSAKSGDKDSDINVVKSEEKNDDETTSETKPASRAGTESPDRSRRYDSRSRDRERERDKREKERELDRLERERERERARRERERELEIQRAERFYKERVKEWEAREKDKEYKRKQERDKEKDRERERRKLIAEQEDESDDDSRKRRRKSEIEDKRRRRRREKEDDLADRLKEEEEIAEAKKRAEEEQQQKQEEKAALELSFVAVANGGEKPMLEDVSSEINHNMEQAQDSDSAPANHIGDGVAVENGDDDDETVMADGPTMDVRPSGNAPAKKLGFGLLGSGKRTAVPSVFHEEEDDDAHKDKKMRPLVPIDYSTEELQAAHTNDGSAPPNSAASAVSGKLVPKEVKSDAERERSRRSHDRSSHRDRDDGDARAREGKLDNKKILDAKQLIDMIPKTKDDLFSYEINWPVYDENRLHERMRPWISKKITEFLGEEETTLVEFIVDKFREHVKAETMLDILQQVLDEEAEMFVLKMWRMLIFEIKRVETGLALRPGA